MTRPGQTVRDAPDQAMGGRAFAAGVTALVLTAAAISLAFWAVSLAEYTVGSPDAGWPITGAITFVLLAAVGLLLRWRGGVLAQQRRLTWRGGQGRLGWILGAVAAGAMLLPLLPATGRNYDETGILPLTVLGAAGIVVLFLLAGAAGPQWVLRALGAQCLLVVLAGVLGHAIRAAVEPAIGGEPAIPCSSAAPAPPPPGTPTTGPQLRTPPPGPVISAPPCP